MLNVSGNRIASADPSVWLYSTFNSLSAKKQTTKFTSANFQKLLCPSYMISKIHKQEGKSVYIDEVAHHEPPHQDLRCLQIHLFSSLVLKKLIDVINVKFCFNI